MASTDLGGMLQSKNTWTDTLVGFPQGMSRASSTTICVDLRWIMLVTAHLIIIRQRPNNCREHQKLTISQV